MSAIRKCLCVSGKKKKCEQSIEKNYGRVKTSEVYGLGLKVLLKGLKEGDMRYMKYVESQEDDILDE